MRTIPCKSAVLCSAAIAMAVAPLARAEISGFVDIGLGERDPNDPPPHGGGTKAGTGELGNFAYAEFTSDEAVTLTRVTFDFTGQDVANNSGPHFVFPVNHGVTSFTTFITTNRVFGFTAIGFDSGDDLMYGLNLDKPSLLPPDGTGTPVGTDYLGGTVRVEFSSGVTLEGTFVDEITTATFFNARARFSGAAFPVPDPPSNLQARVICDQIHVTWQDNSDDETGFKLEYKEYSSLLPEPLTWQEVTLEPDVTSYQLGNLTSSFIYKFRVSSFNAFGPSTFSNEAQVTWFTPLVCFRIVTPNGGEVWAAGSTQQIVWNSGLFPPSHVTIDYSIDGGSHWIAPPIANSIPNTGSYAWTVPATYSDNCIARVRDATDSLYDLSNAPFTIVDPATIVDCDGNGIPDETELAGQDCNNNGVLDSCDIDGFRPDSLVLTRIDAGDGATIVDYSGSGNHGTNTGVTFSPDAPFPAPGNSSLEFNAKADAITFAAGPGTNLNSYDALTIEAFINPTDTMSLHFILWAADGPFTLLLNNELLQFGLVGSGGSRTLSVPFTDTGVWTHVAGTYDGTTARLYVNGHLAKSTAASIGTIGPLVGGALGNVVRIGNDETAVCCPQVRDFRGKIDEVRIAGRALSDAEVLFDATHSFIPGLTTDCDDDGVLDDCEADTDNDSIPDDCDLCPNTIPGATVDANGCPPPIPGDFDNDGDVDQDDVNAFIACSEGPAVPPPPGCEGNDLDQDNDADQEDFAILQRCYSGPNNPADPSCAD